MFKEKHNCKDLKICKGKCQKKTKEGLTSSQCARCELSKERILSELARSNSK